jgi:Ca2+-binding RTX toxin-like protein
MPDIVGTAGNDTLNGTSGDDNVYANGGTDTIDAADGDDLVVLLAQLNPYGTTLGGNGIDTLRIGRSLGFAPQSFGPFGNYQLQFARLINISSFERLQFDSQSGDQMDVQLAFGGSQSGALNLIGAGLSATAQLTGGAGRDSLNLGYSNVVNGGVVTAPSFTYVDWTTPTRAYQSGDRVSISAAGAGSVTIYGSAHAGVQSLNGGAGSDVIYGSDDMDLISGGAGGSDLLYGGGGDDALVLVNTFTNTNGTPGPESTRTGAGTVFDGGTGTDFLVLGGNVVFAGTLQSIEGIFLSPGYFNANFSSPIILGSQNRTSALFSSATFAGLPANLIIDGIGELIIVFGDGGETLNGSGYVLDPGAEVLFYIAGGAGNDTITGTVGDDSLQGAGGADIINGGDGNDFLNSALTLDPIAALIADREYPATAPVLDTGSEVDTLNGGNGDDIIYAGYGDNVDGGAHNAGGGDVLFVSFLAAPGALNLDLSQSTLTVGGGTITGIEHISWVQAGNFDDVITLGGNAVLPAVGSYIPGEGGEFFVFGEGGNDSLTGSGGTDILVGGSGSDVLTGLDGNDVLFSANIAHATIDDLLNDRGFGDNNPPIGDTGAEIDTLAGGAGDDTLFAGFGDNIDGGANGIRGDRLYLNLLGATAGLTLDFATIPASIGGGTITGIENLMGVDGTNFADDIRLGNTATDIANGGLLAGFAGNDILYGNNGRNSIAGGDGADTIYGLGGGDFLSSGNVTEFFSVPNQFAPNSYLMGVDGIYNYNIPILDTGIEADVLIGGGQATYFAGYGDTIIADSANTPNDFLHISFMGATSGVTADFRLASQTIGGGTISGIEYVGWVQGSNYADTITTGNTSSAFFGNEIGVLGMGGDDTIVAISATFIDGGEGNDSIEGGGANNGWVLGGNGDDTIRSIASARTRIEGGAGNDTIYANGGWTYGGSGNDVIVGTVVSGNGSFLIVGEDGDDQITASSGGGNYERISGGNGADTLTGSNNAELLVVGNFALNTTNGSDDLGAEVDTVNAGGGDDEVWIGFGDNADGGAGSDLLHLSLVGAVSGVTLNTANLLGSTAFTLGGGSIANFERLTRLRGSEANDVITVSGLSTSLTVEGGGGDDQLIATTSAVTFNGGEGNDRYTAGLASDVFNGGNGDDWYVGANTVETDRFVGGAGNDTADYSAFTTAITINLGAVAGSGFVGGPAGDLLSSVENLVGGSGNDTLTGSAVANVLNGGAGVSTLNGGAGDDRLILGTGAAGSSIDGGADTDTLVVNSTLTSLAGLISIEALELAGAANLTLTGNQFANGLAFTTALSGTGSITVNMDAGINFLSQGFAFTGSSVTMTVNGTSGTDIIKCGTGVHTINAGDGVDQIRGGTAADIINGGDGNDKIIGFTGADIITGGTGSDQFRYFFQGDSGIGAANSDQLTDFAIGSDKLNFSLIDADAVAADDQAFNFIGTDAFTNTGVGQIRYTNSGADLLVQADVNGDGVADMEIILQGLNGGTLTAGDFIL